jgi:hypothetical protein
VDERRRRRLRHALGGALLAAVGALALAPVAATPACTTHQCDGSSVSITTGRMVDPDTWESSAVDEPWLDYPGERLYFISYPYDVHRPPVSSEAYVALGPTSNTTSGENWVEAAGNLAEFSYLSSAGFLVKNDTCARYYARFVVHFAPAADSGVDAGTDSASSSDAPVEASGDAVSD